MASDDREVGRRIAKDLKEMAAVKWDYFLTIFLEGLTKKKERLRLEPSTSLVQVCTISSDNCVCLLLILWAGGGSQRGNLLAAYATISPVRTPQQHSEKLQAVASPSIIN
jgi:hypothetical protein